MLRALVPDLDQAVSGGTARVFLGEQAGGRRVVLKLTPDPAIAASEAIALRAWADIPQAAGLLDADPGAGVLLLAAVMPGTKVSTWPALPSPTEIAALLTALRAVPPPAAGLRSLADRSGFLFTPHRELPPAAALVPAGLVERGRRAARALAASGPAAATRLLLDLAGTAAAPGWPPGQLPPLSGPRGRRMLPMAGGGGSSVTGTSRGAVGSRRTGREGRRRPRRELTAAACPV